MSQEQQPVSAILGRIEDSLKKEPEAGKVNTSELEKTEEEGEK